MVFLEWLEHTPFALWLAESESIWEYPTVLMLHTVGLALLVGSNAVLDLRILGYGRRLPLASLNVLFRIMWIGLAMNALTGMALFAAAATLKGVQVMFYVKLILIASALLVLQPLRRLVKSGSFDRDPEITNRTKAIAVCSALLWVAAITAGRLMAYVP